MKRKTIPPEAELLPPETHPFPPFIPPDARVLFMGTFPPPAARWAMEFYYPNRNNDFWRIMGIVFYDDPQRFYDPTTKSFREADIRAFLNAKGIALSDTGFRAHRLRGNASDAFLRIVEPRDVPALLARMPSLQAIATTGTLAAETLAAITHTAPPASTDIPTVDPAFTNTEGRPIAIWRMPSTSRAYPLPIAAKAEAYTRLFQSINLITPLSDR